MPVTIPATRELRKDPLFLAALAAGPLCWLLIYLILQPEPRWAWPLMAPLQYLLPALLYPVLEEIVFRGLLQDFVRERISASAFGPLSVANLLTSICFTALHFIYHPPLWAALVLFPSLVFGFFKDRTGHLTAPIVLHVFYNAGFLWLFTAG
ncbi:MAG: JDVT-CTERM system glutamic-type intramembrane protease [Gammaproteobacteria bacterium]